MQVWWLRKIHVSWLIGGWCLGAIIGVVIAAVLPYGWFSSLGWLLLGLALLTRLNTQILLPPSSVPPEKKLRRIVNFRCLEQPRWALSLVFQTPNLPSNALVVLGMQISCAMNARSW